jgi:hypothetical protein
MAREGRTQDGWYGEVPAEFPVTDADRAEWAGEAAEAVDASDAANGEAANPYRHLPARVTPDDTVGEVDSSVPPFDPTTDPNRAVANHWGAGMVGF